MTKLLYQLSIEKKLLIMAAVLIVPALLSLWYAISAQNATIDNVKLERQAVEYTQRLAELSGAVTDHLGLVELQLAGDGSRAGAIETTERKAAAAAADIAKLEASVAEELQAKDQWRAIETEWNELARSSKQMSQEDSRRRHAALLGKLAELIDRQLEHGRLSLDSDPVASRLVDIAIRRIPSAESDVFALRGEAMLAAHSAKLDYAARGRLAARAQRVRDNVIALRASVDKLAAVKAESAGAIRNSMEAHSIAAATFVSAVEDGLVDAETPRLPGASAFAFGAAAYEAAGGLHDVTVSLLSRDLELRLSDQRWQRNLTLLAQTAMLLIGLYLAHSLRQNMTIGASAVLRAIERTAAGKIGRKIDVLGNDEFWQVLSALNQLDDKLVDVVATMRATVETVGAAAKELAEGNDDLNGRTQQQAASIEETAASMEEMTATVKQNAENANQANLLVGGASQQAEKGGAVIKRTVEAMQEINEASRRIADIIGVIDEIAFQTNLLALNAAVEAARAGEQGRGFAVVAAEVRNLAQRSASAAKEIKALINDSVDKVKSGAELVNESGQTLEQIMASVKKVTDVVADIAAASNEQSSGIEQVNRAITQMDNGTQENAAMVEHRAAVSKSVEITVSKLIKEISFFDVKHLNRPVSAPAPIESAKRPSQPQRGKIQPRAVAAAELPTLAKASGDGVWQEF